MLKNQFLLSDAAVRGFDKRLLADGCSFAWFSGCTGADKWLELLAAHRLVSSGPASLKLHDQALTQRGRRGIDSRDPCFNLAPESHLDKIVHEVSGSVTKDNPGACLELNRASCDWVIYFYGNGQFLPLLDVKGLLN